MVYLKAPKNATKKLLEIKVAGYKINIQKLVAFLYTNNEQTEKEIFTKASKTVSHLGINLVKETKDFFNENYKPMKEKN
jgi:hypothetical protein